MVSWFYFAFCVFKAPGCFSDSPRLGNLNCRTDWGVLQLFSAALAAAATHVRMNERISYQSLVLISHRFRVALNARCL
ncbi:hypothetical protein B0F90DRAFT_1712383 [Multifurca ochricompacta]|uniref:Secreted protein n=1 Tax=Multifurca ochricompacta TaxID=376703 RepID=A0AAD4M5T6_9AGAM|nr:hypothetical protein B0F90DRAFT_1712383 [Multifurca ochricompacta]